MDFSDFPRTVYRVGKFFDELVHLSAGWKTIEDLPDMPCERGYLTKSSARFLSFIVFNSLLTQENFDDCYKCINTFIYTSSPQTEEQIASVLRKYAHRMMGLVDLYGYFSLVVQLCFAVQFHPRVLNGLRRQHLCTVVEIATQVINERVSQWTLAEFFTLDKFARFFFNRVIPKDAIEEVPFTNVMAAYRFTFNGSN